MTTMAQPGSKTFHSVAGADTLARRITLPTTVVIHRRGSSVMIIVSIRFDVPVTIDALWRSNARNDSPTTWADVCMREGSLKGLLPAT